MSMDFTQSIEAEQNVLGGLMVSESAWDACGHMLKAEHFYRGDHRVIFSAIAALAGQGKPFEGGLVVEYLRDSGELDRSGGVSYLGELMKNCGVTAPNIGHYAAVITERALYRRALAAYEEGGNDLTDSGRTLTERVTAVCNRLQDTLETDTQAEVPLLYAFGTEWLAEHERMFKSGSQMVGLPTGFADIDKVTLGMPSGELIVIAARPSMGKSAFALNICSNNAMAGKSVFVSSLEMPKSSVMNRFAASVGRVKYSDIRSAQFGVAGAGMARYAASLRDWKLAVDDNPKLDVNKLESRLRAHKRRYGLDLVMVDYLQLMDMGRDPNRNNAVSACTRDLKILAGVMDAPILLLSQLNRDLEKRADKRPQMSDLRDSGSIEQDAHTLIFLYRDSVYNPETPHPEYTEAIIGKARDSERGLVIPLYTALDEMRFSNVDWTSYPRDKK